LARAFALPWFQSAGRLLARDSRIEIVMAQTILSPDHAADFLSPATPVR
jgi:hypothetical protein